MRWIFYTLVVVNLLVALNMLIGGGRQAAQPVATPVESQVEQTVPQIRLLEEVRSTVQTREIPASMHQAPLSCMMAGPFSDEDAARQMSAKLLAHGMNAELKLVERSIGETFWVSIDAAGDEATVSSLHARLKARGVDNFVITEGPLAGRIALGVFSRDDQARQHLEEMQRRGLPAEKESVPRVQSEFWVAVTTGSHVFLEDSLWKSLLASDFQLQQKENFCLDVASR